MIEKPTIGRGAFALEGRATVHLGGGTSAAPPVPVPGFDADNLDDPGNMTATVFVPFNVKVTATLDGLPDGAYAGSVAVTSTSVPDPLFAPNYQVDGVTNDPMTTWVAGVCTQSVQWIFALEGDYIVHLDDGTTAVDIPVTVVL